MSLTRLLLLIAVCLLPVIAAAAQTTPNCDALPARLVVAEAGRVAVDVTVNLRAEAGRAGAVIGQLPTMAAFTVTGAPSCADGFRWWPVIAHLADEVSGWIAEGDPADGTYWTEPRGQRVQVVGAFDQPRWLNIGADGVSEAEGCLAPPDDYTRTTVRGGTLNARTLAMLDQAQRLYRVRGGTAQFRQSVTQGSYTGGTLVASFGTHDAGGAVDLRITRLADGRVNYADLGRMIEALRAAGFAAWLRESGQLYANSPIHIHAIAVGDAELSPAAYTQVYGDTGYFAGWDALPPDWGGPNPDPHGGPVTCRWMQP